MVSLFVLVLQLLSLIGLTAGAIISKPNCTDRCGKVQIPYPFGIGSSCYRDPSYEIICNTSFGNPKLFLRQLNLEVLDINWRGRNSRLETPYLDTEDAQESLQVAVPPPNLCGGDGNNSVKRIRSHDLKGTPYLFSADYNVLMMEGCGGSVVLRNRSGIILAGCASICYSDAAARTGNESACYGVGCCQASLPSPLADDSARARGFGLDYYEIEVLSIEQRTKSNSCDSFVALIDQRSVKKLGGSSLSSLESIPIGLSWYATWVPKTSFQLDNVTCYYGSCVCQYPFEGNPYIPDGCQVVEECRNCADAADCHHLINSIHEVSFYCNRSHSLLRRASFLGSIIAVGMLLLFLGCYFLYKFVKRGIEIKRKAKHFKRNGGLLLQQQISSDDRAAERTKVFAITDLHKATNNFNENWILGQGGQGTVYKGMLMDGKIVAIKKSRKVDESQVEQFINEVVILSQINHRNVVKLLGCCLETEVPVLVYEYVPNGTVYEHLHGQSEDFHLTWKMRLQIAVESAGAVAYLHSSISAPVYHRDIKSTNILLDEKFRAKVSDFGTSKAITIEQTHVTTAVLGTYGYLDPEYFLSNQFTEKSDVYSFGVVLVELLTGKKPICPTGNGGWINLTIEFLTQMEDCRSLDVIDSRIVDEGKEEEFMAVAKLAKRCLNMKGKRRPTMKEIAMQLDGIKSSNMPFPKDLSPAESEDDDETDLIHSDNGPLGESSFSLDEPLPCSIEIKPVMAHDT